MVDVGDSKLREHPQTDRLVYLCHKYGEPIKSNVSLSDLDVQ